MWAFLPILPLTGLTQLSGCGVQLPDPVLQSVEPDRGWNGEETVLNVQGGNFYPEVEINANRRGEADFDRGFQAFLRSEIHGQIALDGVSAVDYENLRAVVQPGLESGLYDLVVVSPTGREAVLPASYTVSDTRADRLEIDAPVSAQVNVPVRIDLSLLAPGIDGEVVPTDLEVEVEVQASDGESTPGISFTNVGLENVILAPDGDSLTGFLGPDGLAGFSLTVDTPGAVEILVAPLDPTSPIRSDTEDVDFSPGQNLVAVVELPEPDFTVTAGESFDVDIRVEDEFGNVVPFGDSIAVILPCGGAPQFGVVPPVTISAVLFDATVLENNCAGADARVQVVGGVNGQSEPIVVLPGPVDRFDVSTDSLPVTAGTLKSALVVPRDTLSNRTTFTGDLAITDSVDGIVDFECDALDFDDQVCRYTSTIAGEQIQLTAESNGLSGQSNPYVITAEPVPATLAVDVSGPVVAGEEFPVQVGAFDQYGNLIDAGDLSEATVTDSAGEVECTADAPLPDGTGVYGCLVTTAAEDVVFTAQLAGLFANSTPVTVDNGEAALADVVVPPSIVAGSPFTVEVDVFDAFGNPYLVQTVPSIELARAADGTSLGTAALDAMGSAQAQVTLFESGVTVVEAVGPNGSLGQSAPISVQPGVADSLVVTPLVPWAFTGTPTFVRIEAIDQFGNRGTESLAVTLESANGAGPVVSTTLNNGAVTTPFSWTSPQFDETLDATAGTLVGSSIPLDVVADCGSDGPTAVLDFAGAPSGRACWDPVDGSATLAASLVGTVPGLEPIGLYAVSVDAEVPQTSSTPAFTVEVSEIGPNPVSALVADAAGCGSAVDSTVWAGLDDGNAVGALSILSDREELTIGVDTTDLSVVAATDCTGDPATGTLVVRTDRGELSGTTPTGTGLEVPVDAMGGAELGLSAIDVTMGGAAEVTIASPTGGGSGVRQLSFLGDDRLPWVYSQAPHGDTTGQVSSVSLVFSEPMLDATMVPANFEVTGPETTAITGVTEVSPASWTLTLDPPVSADAGVYTVRATQELRDEAGNRLDGTYGGAATDWVGTFGAIPGGPDPVTCSTDISRFRPDGDPGAGEEADTFRVDLTTTSLPAWWVATVRDGSDDIVFRRRLVPVGIADAWSWNGRDITERVVDDGTYTVTVEPEDGFGNRGSGCSVSVQVDNAIEPGVP